MLPEILLVLLTSLNWYSKTTTLPKLSPDNFPKIFPENITNSYNQKYYSVPIQNSFNLLENDEQLNYSAPFRNYNFQEMEKY